MLTITAEERKILGKTSQRLPEEKMAAVYYGHKEKTTPIVVSKAEFKKIYKAAGESSVITLEADGKKLEALIHDVDFDPIKGEPRHADFYILEKGKKVTVSVPLHFEGESNAVKTLGGILIKVMHEVEIEAESKDLPHAIVVDLSKLAELDSNLSIEDLDFPKGVTPVGDVTEVVAAVSRPKDSAEEETPSLDLSAIEVEKKGKKEEEAEAAE